MNRILPCALVLAVLAPAPLAAQPAPPPDRPGETYHGRQGQVEVRVPKITAELEIDGRLDEAAWADAALLTGFSQYQPVDRLPADDSTEVMVLYTDHAMYFGVRA